MNFPTPCAPAGATPLQPPDDRILVRYGTLAGTLARLDVAAASSPGRRHYVNEDAHSTLDGTTPLYVVADGVGGGAMAAWASRQLVSLVHRGLDRATVDARSVRDALLEADREVGRCIARSTDELGAATVALGASVSADFSAWLVAWVGDCRAYRLRHGEASAVLLTRDDTYRHLAETPPPGGSPDDPARMLGNGAVTEPNVANAVLGLDDILLLCSDGVHAHVGAHDLAAVLGAAGAPLAQRCASVVRLARERGGSDDATVLAIHRAARPTPSIDLKRSER